jgi:hypothetical protein
LHAPKTEVARYDSSVPTIAKIVELLKETGFQNPEGKSPFEYAFGESLWNWVGSDAQRQTDMMNYMAGRRKGSIRWVDVFKPESLLSTARTGKEDVLLVDVGGNQGHDLKMFQEHRGNLPGRLILQDLPEAVKKHEKQLEGIEVMAYDFFTPQPIKGSNILICLILLETVLTEHRCSSVLFPCNMPRLV